MSEQKYSVSVLITTKNRKAELRKAMDSVLMQTAPLELLIFDDGSTDQTSEMVRAEYPTVRLERVEQSLGIIAARNRAMSLARGEVVITIDDDCLFTTPHVVAQTLTDFDHPRIAAVAIPSTNMLPTPEKLVKAPPTGIHLVSCYRGGCNAILREVFLAAGGYREFLYRQGEEQDLCLRLLDRGYVVRLGRADTIEHWESPVRDRGRIIYYNSRSHVLFAGFNAPLTALVPHVAVTSWNCLRWGMQTQCTNAALRGLLAGYGGIVRQWRQRRAVSRQTYRLLRMMRQAGGPLLLDQIEPHLPSWKPLTRS